MVATAPPGYLDAAATEPLHPAARAAWEAAADLAWADPGRRYGAARRARLILDQARATVAEVLGCRPDEVVFTSSGTTAIHLGVLGALAGRRRVGDRLVVSAVEHSAVLHSGESHVAAAGSVETVPVDATGRVDLAAWQAAVSRPGTALACLQAANHEVGTVQPVAEAAQVCAAHGVPLLVDAAQVVGREVPDGWSLLTASAAKWGGPPGVGVLAIRQGVRWRSPLPADDREAGRVPGRPAVPAIAAAAAALAAVAGPGALAEAGAEDVRLSALVERIRTRVATDVPDVQVVGDPTRRLPHVVTFSCLYVDGEALLDELDRQGFAVSSGSSCTSDTLEPSHVLVAMGVLSQGNVRVSLPRGVAEADVERFLAVLPGVVEGVRAGLGATGL
jgi:cysteine desulfurase